MNKATDNTNNITPETERRMRILANLIIDRIFEDRKHDIIKYNRIQGVYKMSEANNKNKL